MAWKNTKIGILSLLALAFPIVAAAETPVPADTQRQAFVETPPRRGLRTLCRMSGAEAERGARRNGEGRARHFVWLDAARCSAPARAVELLQQMPDSDVVGLLENQGRLLASARLLFAGNTSCARQRSFNYSLSQIDMGAVGSSSEVMAALVYKSDRNTMAKVWVKRSGLEYTAWNVSCQ